MTQPTTAKKIGELTEMEILLEQDYQNGIFQQAQRNLQLLAAEIKRRVEKAKEASQQPPGDPPVRKIPPGQAEFLQAAKDKLEREPALSKPNGNSETLDFANTGVQGRAKADIHDQAPGGDTPGEQ